jgi:hypothetical protein
MRKNPVMVDREGGMRFFAGVPLMGSSGHRLGMLIIIDQQPRRITADQVAVLVNMSGGRPGSSANRFSTLHSSCKLLRDGEG